MRAPLWSRAHRHTWADAWQLQVNGCNFFNCMGRYSKKEIKFKNFEYCNIIIWSEYMIFIGIAGSIILGSGVTVQADSLTRGWRSLLMNRIHEYGIRFIRAKPFVAGSGLREKSQQLFLWFFYTVCWLTGRGEKWSGFSFMFANRKRIAWRFLLANDTFFYAASLASPA